MIDYSDLKAEYIAAVEASLASVHPDCRPLHHMGLPSFARWLRDEGIEPQKPDPSDPYTARRLAQYMAHREEALGHLEPEPRSRVEPYFLPFEEWLHMEEVHEKYFGPSAKPKKPQRARRDRA